MKKLILLLVVLLTVVSESSQAQTYEQNKNSYTDTEYKYEYGDPYNPTLCGVASFFIPGLGQIICGETDRGLQFMGGEAGCALLLIGSSVVTVYNGAMGNENARKISSGVMLLSFVGAYAITIWSTVDAVKVAKINNLYYREPRNTSLLKLEIAPYVSQLNINNQLTTPVGMTLRVKF